MAVLLVPGVFGAGGQILDSNGRIANGALVGTYAAGTTSPVAVFTTVAGNVTAANPIVCSADGRLPHELWQTAGTAIKITLTDSVGNTLGGPYDNLTGINDIASILTTTNTWTGQQTFSGVFISTLTVNTVTATNINASSLTVSTLSVNSTATFLNIVNWAQATPIATISSINVASATGNFVDLTGTNTVTSLGPITAGAVRFIRFSGIAPILNSVSQILPGGSTITSAAGDMALAISLGGGNWVYSTYQKADGSGLATTTPTAAQGSSLVLLSTTSAVSSATVDFTTNINATYDDYQVHFFNVLPATGAQFLYMRISQAGSFKTDASGYFDGSTGTNSNAIAAQAFFRITETTIGMNNVATNSGANGIVYLQRPSNTTRWKNIRWEFDQQTNLTNSDPYQGQGAGFYNINTAAIDGLRFFISSSNMVTGQFYLYGVKKS